MLRLNIILLSLLFIFSSKINASEKNEQIVLEVYPQWFSTDKYTLQGNIGIQKLYDHSDWVQYYVKPSISYPITDKWGLHGGLGLYYTRNQQSDDYLEVRPYQGLSHYHLLNKRWKLSSYLRIEERFLDHSEDSVRFRFRLRTEYMLNSLNINSAWHKITFGLEGFKSYYKNYQYTDSLFNDKFSREFHAVLGAERSINEIDKVRFELAWKYKVPMYQLLEAHSNTIYFKIKYYPTWGDIRVRRFRLFDIDQ